MSAGTHSQVAHLCAVLCGQRVIARIGDPVIVKERLRISDDTFGRMQRTTVPARWTYPRLIDLAALERDVLHTTSLDEVLDHRQRAFPQPDSHGDIQQLGRDFLRHLSRRNADLTEAIVSGSGIDDTELRRELDKLPEYLAALHRFRVAGEARLNRPRS